MKLCFADPLGAAKPVRALLFACALLVLAAPEGRAQHWSDGVWPQADWAAAMAQFDSVWADSIPAKGKGFKPFMRWRTFCRSPDGPMTALLTSSPQVPGRQPAGNDREGRPGRTNQIRSGRERFPKGCHLSGVQGV